MDLLRGCIICARPRGCFSFNNGIDMRSESNNTCDAAKVWAVIFVVLFISVTGVISGWQLRKRFEPHITGDTLSIKRDTVRDTVYTFLKDSLPLAHGTKETGKLCLPVAVPETVNTSDSIPDTVTAELPIVQKEYRRDSLYVAYVSGIGYGDFPRLDSIAVTQRTAYETVTNTITVRKPAKRFTVGIFAGYGISMRTWQPEPVIAVGVGYRVW